MAAIRAVDGHLVLSTMVYDDEVVSPASIDELRDVADVELTKREMTMAEALVESLAAEFEPDKYKDAYREQVLDLIERKAAGEVFDAPVPVAAAPQVVDLMAALEASVRAAKEARGRHPAATSTPKPVTKLAGRARSTAAAAEADETEAPKKPARARARKSA